MRRFMRVGLVWSSPVALQAESLLPELIIFGRRAERAEYRPRRCVGNREKYGHDGLRGNPRRPADSRPWHNIQSLAGL